MSQPKGMREGTRSIPGPYDPEEMRRFLASFMYREEAFLVDEVVRLDAEAREIEARMDTTRELPFAAQQRVWPGHPAHVAAFFREQALE